MDQKYCSVVRHSTLTVQQKTDIENVQKLCIKIMLGPDYTDCDQAIKFTGLENLSIKREARCLKFGLKSLTQPVHCKLFPVNPHANVTSNQPSSSNRENFHVKWARTESYRMSALPHIQRMLNNCLKKQKM